MGLLVNANQVDEVTASASEDTAIPLRPDPPPTPLERLLESGVDTIFTVTGAATRSAVASVLRAGASGAQREREVPDYRGVVLLAG